jgi:flagellar basal-body rod protein FlgF
MLNSVFITLPGKYTIQRRMEAIANNLANASTAGYKSSRPSFQMTSSDAGAGGNSSLTLPQTTIGDLDAHVYFAEGPMIETGNKLDAAIQGNGFFVVKSETSESGVVYTRNGQFTLDSNKRLVTMDGSPVMGQGGGDIILDGKDIAIGENGNIYVDKQQAGQLKIVDFKDKAALRNQGKSSFVNTSSVMEETTPDRYSVKAGFYENSNVNVVMEMVDMMTAMRAYESYSKVDQGLNEVMTKLLDVAR